MGLIDKNSLLAGIHGPVGNLTIVHQNGKAIARRKPTVRPKATPRRVAHQVRFRAASKWARSVLTVPEIAAVYQEAAKGTGLSPHNLAVADYMHDPVIEDIELSGYTGKKGETIRVRAKDGLARPVTISLSEVRVIIRNVAEAILEQGNATPDGGAWRYLTQTDLPPRELVKVEVTAKDRPGHSATKTLPHLTAG